MSAFVTPTPPTRRQRARSLSRRTLCGLALYVGLLMVQNLSLHVESHRGGDGHEHGVACLLFALFEAPATPATDAGAGMGDTDTRDRIPAGMSGFLHLAGALLSAPLALLLLCLFITSSAPPARQQDRWHPTFQAGRPGSPRAPPLAA